MTIRKILYYPHEALTTPSERVEVVDDAVRLLVDDMFETLYHHKAWGLAANQIGVMKQIMVMDVNDKKAHPLCLVNLEILETQGSATMDEGCLSFPDLRVPVKRPEWLKIKALDRDGNPFELEADGYLARCIQHEYDHLQGKVYIDYTSPLRRGLLLERLEKAKNDY